jgi:hypothetical protein
MKNKGTATSPAVQAPAALINKFSLVNCGHKTGDSGVSEQKSNNKYSLTNKGK